MDLAAQSEYLGTLALLGADGTEPLSALENDLRDIGIGLDVVEDGGLAEDTGSGREGRTGTGLTALAVDRGHQGSFLAAHKGAGAQTQLHIEIEAGAQDILAQQTHFPGLVNGVLETLYRNGILSTDIDKAWFGADGIGGNGQASMMTWGRLPEGNGP